jgi:hypothetical protein
VSDPEQQLLRGPLGDTAAAAAAAAVGLLGSLGEPQGI